MDYQDAPTINLSDKQQKINDEMIRKFLRNNDKKVQEQIKKLRNSGYSDKEINEYYAF
jgi:adenine-specific DNA methylase